MDKSSEHAKVAAPAGLASVLTTAQILLPWLAGLAAAATAFRPNPGTPAAAASASER